jgi:hypothetical protein
MKPPTILDVNAVAEDSAWEEDFLKRLELHVLLCPGPEAKGACPILEGEVCPLVSRADGILFQLDLDREDHRTILARYAEMLDVPIRVVVTKEQAAKYADLLRDVEVMSPPVGPAGLDGFAAEVEHQ